MNLENAIEQLGAKASIEIAKTSSLRMNLNWDKNISFIFSVILSDPTRAPKMGAKNDTPEKVIEKWTKKYKGGYEGRPSLRASNPLGTIADPIIEVIIGARLDNLTKKDQQFISDGHRLGMSAENILGLLLEEYLAINLDGHGWHCAWGETIKSVDFVKEDGSLLQVKNRSNSENSSSSAIRLGTTIEKWYRIKADRVEYKWDDLNAICGVDHLSEESFIKFVKKVLSENPACLYVENHNSWKKA